MAEEEQQNQRSNKKPKQKKIPQRGLGVAQLEKIRLEEQKKNASTSLISFPPHSPIPFPPQSPTDLVSSNSLFKSSISISNFELLSPPLPPPPPPPPPPSPPYSQEIGLGFMPPPVLWNPLDFNHDWEGRKFDTFRPPFHNDSSSSSNPVWRPPVFLQRKQEPYPVMNFSTSSGVNLQREPPSNQSYYSNSTRSWPQEERMVGMKRPWPFALDDPPANTFHYKFPPFVPPSHRYEELSSSFDAFKMDSKNPILFREGRSNSSTIPSSSNTYQADDINPTKENECMDECFLTLAPPATTSNLKPELPPFQGSMKVEFLRTSASGPPQPFYSFLPVGPTSHTANSSDQRGEGSESVDLNLKL
ncbi:uncharacterized protein LOC143861743 [Tasmannia lanceolata]|uniref:uncharacterized protein LOC143861743 n=1 Tax=Tasmannia lanceolata TaxID=3420 RepID=UPI0040630B29